MWSARKSSGARGAERLALTTSLKWRGLGTSGLNSPSLFCSPCKATSSTKARWVSRSTGCAGSSNSASFRAALKRACSTIWSAMTKQAKVRPATCKFCTYRNVSLIFERWKCTYMQASSISKLGLDTRNLNYSIHVIKTVRIIDKTDLETVKQSSYETVLNTAAETLNRTHWQSTSKSNSGDVVAGYALKFLQLTLVDK